MLENWGDKEKSVTHDFFQSDIILLVLKEKQKRKTQQRGGNGCLPTHSLSLKWLIWLTKRNEIYLSIKICLNFKYYPNVAEILHLWTLPINYLPPPEHLKCKTQQISFFSFRYQSLHTSQKINRKALSVLHRIVCFQSSNKYFWGQHLTAFCI